MVPSEESYRHESEHLEDHVRTGLLKSVRCLLRRRCVEVAFGKMRQRLLAAAAPHFQCHLHEPVHIFCGCSDIQDVVIQIDTIMPYAIVLTFTRLPCTVAQAIGKAGDERSS